jgi:formate-dependent nitrite reductase membrane component NrfD
MPYIEKQKSWGWAVAAYVFLAGVGGGLFLVSFVLDLLGKLESVARIGAALGPVLVLIGTFFLLADLGSVSRVYRLFTSASTIMASWLVRGVWILTFFIIAGLAYSLPAFTLFEWLPWSKASGVVRSIGMVTAFLSVLVMVYPGFLLGVAKGIPFWNTSILPLLLLVSGLDTGIATIVVIGLLFTKNFGADSLHQLDAVDTTLVFTQLIVLGAYIEIVRHGGVTTMASIRLLKTALFIGGALVVGLLLPLFLLLYSLIVTNTNTLQILAFIAGLFLLIGGLCLRYSIIRAGVFLAKR